MYANIALSRLMPPPSDISISGYQDSQRLCPCREGQSASASRQFFSPTKSPLHLLLLIMPGRSDISAVVVRSSDVSPAGIRGSALGHCNVPALLSDSVMMITIRAQKSRSSSGDTSSQAGFAEETLPFSQLAGFLLVPPLRRPNHSPPTTALSRENRYRKKSSHA